MNAYVKEIVLFSKNGDMRRVSLEEGLNIITGDSKTGKSALLEIVDYCLFSSRSTIPVGKITEFTEIFCIILKIKNKYLVIGRPHWKSGDRLKAYFSFEANSRFIDTFSFEYFSNKSLRTYKDVQLDVEKHLGLSVTDTRESIDSERRGAGKATMRSFVSLIFQHQNLIANKHSLFYRFDDYQKRKKTIEQLPVLLGWVDGDYYALKQRYDLKKKKLSTEQKRLKSIKLTTDEEIQKLRIPINQYFTSLGYILDKDLSLRNLKKLAGDLPVIPQSAYEDSDIKSQLLKLEKNRKEFRTELSDVNILIDQISNNNNHAYDYGKLLNQIVSANENEELEKSLECPVCHHKTTEVEKTIVAVKSSRNNLIAELKNVGSYKNDSSQHLTQLIDKKDILKKKIRIISSEIGNLEKVSQKGVSEKALRETLMRLKGRIEVTLEQVLHKPTLGQSSLDIDELKSEIKFIEEKLAGYALDTKFEEANSFISQRMTSISERLDFESELQPGKMHFDLKNFDFFYNYNRENIRLSEMGSGANWLACHLSLFLALLHLSCKESGNSIPSFLFLDQPSQVYFPKTTKVITSSDSELGEDDENIKQVKNIFNVILAELSEMKKDYGFVPQIVVMEHADEKEFYSYVKKRWATDGEKLI